jgi:hypothetical protein
MLTCQNCDKDFDINQVSWACGVTNNDRGAIVKYDNVKCPLCGEK